MDYPNFRLDDQVALVTGASRGIGYGLAKALAAAGARVAVAARDVSALETLAGQIRSSGGDAHAVPLDVRDIGQIDAATGASKQLRKSLVLGLPQIGIALEHLGRVLARLHQNMLIAC